jgi:hypothetical protein
MPKQYPWSWLNRLDIGRKQMHPVAAITAQCHQQDHQKKLKEFIYE